MIGTSEDLERQYSRRVPSDPSEVRPERVLKKALQHLKEKWKNEKNYKHICEQFKTVRQDLIVQRIANQFAVEVYETHARIALENYDLWEFNACQTQLSRLYSHLEDKEGSAPKTCLEFLAYRLLYFLYNEVKQTVTEIVCGLNEKTRKHPALSHAIQVFESLENFNYSKLFRLSEGSPNMGDYLMCLFLPKIRKRALIVITTAYRPTVTLEFLSKALHFKNKKEFNDFVGENVVLVKNSKSDVDCKGTLEKLG